MTVESIISIMACEPEFNEHQVMTIFMVASRCGLVIMSVGELQEMKNRMDQCPGHPEPPFQEFTR